MRARRCNQSVSGRSLDVVSLRCSGQFSQTESSSVSSAKPDVRHLPCALAFEEFCPKALVRPSRWAILLWPRILGARRKEGLAPVSHAHCSGPEDSRGGPRRPLRLTVTAGPCREPHKTRPAKIPGARDRLRRRVCIGVCREAAVDGGRRGEAWCLVMSLSVRLAKNARSLSLFGTSRLARKRACCAMEARYNMHSKAREWARTRVPLDGVRDLHCADDGEAARRRRRARRSTAPGPSKSRMSERSCLQSG